MNYGYEHSVPGGGAHETGGTHHRQRSLGAYIIGPKIIKCYYVLKIIKIWMSCTRFQWNSTSISVPFFVLSNTTDSGRQVRAH